MFVYKVFKSTEQTEKTKHKRTKASKKLRLLGELTEVMIYQCFDKQPVSQLCFMSKCKQKVLAGNIKLLELSLQFCSNTIVKLERCTFQEMH